MRSLIAVIVLLLCGSFADAHNVGGGVLNRLFNVGNNNHHRGQQQQFNRFFNQGHNHNHGQAQFFNGGYVNRNFFPGYGAGYGGGASFAPQCYVPPPQVPVYYQQPQYYLAPQPVLQLAIPQYAPVYAAPACGVGYGQGGCGVGASRLFGY